MMTDTERSSRTTKRWYRRAELPEYFFEEVLAAFTSRLSDIGYGALICTDVRLIPPGTSGKLVEPEWLYAVEYTDVLEERTGALRDTGETIEEVLAEYGLSDDWMAPHQTLQMEWLCAADRLTTCMWCGKPYPSEEAVEEHEQQCQGT